jgi:divalent metal cation (Fe/Co/Zn/Cd) transporter
LSVEEAHKIAETIENRMYTGIKSLEHVTVHVEPSGVAIPTAEIDESQLQNVIEKVAKGIAKNIHIKKVVTYVSENKRYINIDCCFTRQVQIKEAHRLASQVEKETKEHFANAVVTVHIEPEGI